MRLLLVGRLITSLRAAAIGWPTHYVTARDCYWLMALTGHYKSRSTAVDQELGVGDNYRHQHMAFTDIGVACNYLRM